MSRPEAVQKPLEEASRRFQVASQRLPEASWVFGRRFGWKNLRFASFCRHRKNALDSKLFQKKSRLRSFVSRPEAVQKPLEEASRRFQVASQRLPEASQRLEPNFKPVSKPEAVQKPLEEASRGFQDASQRLPEASQRLEPNLKPVSRPQAVQKPLEEGSRRFQEASQGRPEASQRLNLFSPLCDTALPIFGLALNPLEGLCPSRPCRVFVQPNATMTSATNISLSSLGLLRRVCLSPPLRNNPQHFSSNPKSMRIEVNRPLDRGRGVETLNPKRLRLGWLGREH